MRRARTWSGRACRGALRTETITSGYFCIAVPTEFLRFRNTGLRSFFLHQPAVRDAYARPAHIGLPYSPLHDHKTLANTRNVRSYYVNASHRRGDRGRAPTAAIAHHDRLWGRSRRLIISPAHGASVEPQGCRALVVTSESTHVVLRLYLGQLVGWLVDVTIQKPC